MKKKIIVNEVIGYRSTFLSYLWRGIPIVMVYEIVPYGVWEDGYDDFDCDSVFLILANLPDGSIIRHSVSRSEDNARQMARDRAKTISRQWAKKMDDEFTFLSDVCFVRK